MLENQDQESPVDAGERPIYNSINGAAHAARDILPRRALA